ncbi:TPA: hypothetical protein ACNIQM_002093 [Citrobacter werkmanii]
MSNDPNAMQQVIAQFPKFGQQMLQMIGIRDDQHRQAVGSMGIRVAGLLEDGDVQGAQDVIRQNANLFDPTGEGSADNIINDIGKGATDPNKLAQWKNRMQKLTLSTLSPREIMNWGTDQQRMAQQLQLGEEQMQLRREISQNQLGMQGARLQEISDFHNQMLELKRQSILNAGGGDVMADTQGNPLTPFDYNRLLLQSGTDPRTGKRATGAQLSNAQKWMAGNESFTSAQETLHQQLGKIDDLLSGDKLESGTGRFAGRAPSLLTSGEGIDVRNLLDSIKSGEFTTNVQKLRGMGALSNAEGAKLMDLTAKIDETQPTDVIRKQLKAIRDQYRALAKANLQDAADMGYGQRKLQAYTGGSDDVSGMSDDDLLEGL